MIRPQRMLSPAVLNDPANRETLRAMAGLVVDEQMIQLCTVEAMEQIAAWDETFAPELLIAYAMADTRISAHAVEAEGGAFFSHARWYNVAFRCDLSADRKEVAAFEFRVGEAIPKSEWEAHDLPSGGGHLD